MCYKAAVIGCGRIGTTLEDDVLREHPCTHAGALDACEGVKITAGCDIDQKRVESFGKKWGVNRLYTDYKKLLENEKPEILCIASWSYTHCDMVLHAVDCGVRAILCEKPIALSLSDARKMVDACKRSGVILSVNHERRWDATYIKVRDMLASGEIGELRTIIGNVLTGNPVIKKSDADYRKLGGGPLLHDGTHLFDIMRFIAGDVAWVIGDVSREDKEIAVEDRASAYMRFDGGAYGFVEGGGRRNYFNFELDIQGSDGRIIVGNGILKFWRSGESSRYSGFRDLVPDKFPEVNRKSPYLSGVEELVAVMDGKKTCTSTGEDGMKALELIMAVYESARLGGIKTFLPVTLSHNPLEQMILQHKI